MVSSAWERLSYQNDLIKNMHARLHLAKLPSLYPIRDMKILVWFAFYIEIILTAAIANVWKMED